VPPVSRGLSLPQGAGKSSACGDNLIRSCHSGAIAPRRSGGYSSAYERAFLDRIRSLNEEETEKLPIEAITAYLNIMHKNDPRLVRLAFEKTFIDAD
jgi:hypothetical protein